MIVPRLRHHAMTGMGTDVYSGWTRSGGQRVWVRVPAELKRRANGNGGPMRPGQRWWRSSSHRALNGHGPLEAGPGTAPIVLVHPIGMSSRAMVPLLRALGPDREVFAPDLPGFGMSDTPPTPLGVPGLAAALRRWMIDNQVAPATVVAASLGSQVAVELAARNPALVERLVLVGPPLPSAVRRPRRLARRVGRAALCSARMTPALLRDRLDVPPWRLRRERRLAIAYDIEGSLPEVEAPTLVVRGERDRIVSAESVERIAGLLPRARTATLERSRHMPAPGAARGLADTIESFIAADPPPQAKRGGAGGAAPRSRWIVDGMNLIGSRPDGWWRDREAAWKRLHDELSDHVRASGDDLELFLDGRRPRDWHDDGLVETTFAAGGPNAADDAIAARVAADPHPVAVRVVTSDRELAKRVRELGAEVTSTGEFRRALRR
ncbi:MAG: NYN domain-containing protein [Solirubrobacterales bacterium]